MPIENQPSDIWAAMAQLTPTAFDIILRPVYGLRKMADKVNRNLTTWIRDDYWDLANVVASDFFLGNNIIDVALEANLKRRWCLDAAQAQRTYVQQVTTTTTQIPVNVKPKPLYQGPRSLETTRPPSTEPPSTVTATGDG